MRYYELLSEDTELGPVEMPDSIEWRQASTEKTGVMTATLTAYQRRYYANGASSRRDVGQLCIYKDLTRISHRSQVHRASD
jgi:hypothetical protein